MMKRLYLLTFVFLFASAPAQAKPQPKKPETSLQSLTAPSCGIPGADAAACTPVTKDQDANRLLEGARAKEAPYQAKRDRLEGDARGIPCRISSDCPTGLFCSPQGFCGKVGTSNP